MIGKNFRKMMILGVVLVYVLSGYARADKQQLHERLSKEIKIQLDNVTIAEALEKIGQKVDVKFVLSHEAAWKLPLGEATRLSVALQGPLAESMTEMLNTFFMRYAVGDEQVTIYPRPELVHILGRPTIKQLELLKAIYTNSMSEYVSGQEASFVNKLLGQEVLVLSSDWYKEFGKILDSLRAESGELSVNVSYSLSTPITMAHLLDSCEEWYLSGPAFSGKVPEIRVVDIQDFRYARLNQVVDISFKEERADVIIQRLANWTGMELYIDKEDPLWLSEEITVDMENIKLRQAIVNIVSTVDGQVRSIDYEDNIIYIKGPIHRQKPRIPRRTAPSSPAKSEAYVGKISIPMKGGKYYIEFMLRESELTEELKKLRAEKMKEILGESLQPDQGVEPASKSQEE